MFREREGRICDYIYIHESSYVRESGDIFSAF